MEIQRLRNLTTGKLHTAMADIYEDLGTIIGESGLMTHMLRRANRAIEPWLREQVPDPRFWDDKYDVTHLGVYELPEPTKEEREAMMKLYLEQPDPLAGKNVTPIQM